MIGTLLTIGGSAAGLALALLALRLIGRRAGRAARASHDFRLNELLDEPGISDVYGGRVRTPTTCGRRE